MSSLPTSKPIINNQAVLRVRKQIEDFPIPRSKLHSFSTASNDNYASSRETTPSAEGSYLSAPSSITSVSSPVELLNSQASSLYAAESCGESRASYQSDPVEDNTADTTRSESQRPIHEHRQYALLFSKPTIRDSGTHRSNTGCEVAEDTDDEAESLDDYDEATEDEDEDNDWSGEDGGLEALAISALGGDLAGAVSIIPALHRYMNSRIQRKVESWQTCAASGSHSSSGNDNNGMSSNTGKQSSPGSSRKRRRVESDRGENHGDGEDEGNEGEGHDPPADQLAPPEEVQQPMLACPFNKHDRIKYSATADKKYRTCAGPGFKSIQRLREHLKRTHSPVQCDRCYKIFPFKGENRAAAMEALAAHRQIDVPCDRGDPSLKEGINDAQWAQLDGLNRKINKYQISHRTEKWIEIWKIIYPNEEPPTPWYENVIAETFSNRSASSSQQIDDFVSLCMLLMNHRLPDLVMAQGQLSMESHEILARILRQACEMWTGLNRNIPGSQSSSSIHSNNLSSLSGGSSTNLTAPTAYTPTSHDLMQASGSNTQPTFNNLNTNVNQTMAIEPQSNGRKRNLDASQQHRFQQPSIPVSLSSGPGPAMQMTYIYENTEPWPMNGGFMEPNNMGPPHMLGFPDQWAPPNPQYHQFPADESAYFPQTQGYSNGMNMDDDGGNLQ